MKKKIIDFADNLLWDIDSVIIHLSEEQKLLITAVVSIMASVGTVLITTGLLTK